MTIPFNYQQYIVTREIHVKKLYVREIPFRIFQSNYNGKIAELKSLKIILT